LTEAELFVELLDDKELTKIIRALKITLPGGFRVESASIAKKKRAIKTALKTTPIGKRRKIDLFLELMNFYSIENLEGVADEDYLVVLSELKAPEYAKFAYTLTKRSTIFKDIYNELLDKHQRGAEILFDYSEQITNEEDAITSVKSFYKLNDSDYPNIWIRRVVANLSEEQLKEFKNIVPYVEDLAFHEFMRVKNELKQQFNEALILLAYAQSREELDPAIRSQYAFAAALEIVDSLRNAFASKAQVAIDKLRRTEKELEAERKGVTKLERQYQVLENQMESIQVEFNSYKEKERNRLEEVAGVHHKERENLEIEYKKKNEKISKEANVFKNGVSNLLNMISGWAGDREPYKEFAVIYSQDTHLFLELYPEITAFSMKEWKKNELELKQYPIIYVQRDGCSSAQLAQMKKSIPGFRTFDAQGDKEMIEHIEEIKKKEGVLFVTV
jgi:hypothetical protein